MSEQPGETLCADATGLFISIDWARLIESQVERDRSRADRGADGQARVSP